VSGFAVLGHIEPSAHAPELDDERRRYYRITPFGRAVAKAEARRLTAFAAIAFLLAGIGIHGLLSFAVSERPPSSPPSA
jgi:hypothetical protein